MTGHFPGETVDVGLCFYKQSDADAGGYFPAARWSCRSKRPLRPANREGGRDDQSSPFPHRDSFTNNVMETIMKPLSISPAARRGG